MGRLPCIIPPPSNPLPPGAGEFKALDLCKVFSGRDTIGVSRKYPTKLSGGFAAAGFSLRLFFLIISQAKACGYILNAHG
jgi:hypothetical protein